MSKIKKIVKTIKENINSPCKIKVRKKYKNAYEIKVNDKKNFSISWDEKTTEKLKKFHNVAADKEAVKIISAEINQYLEGAKNE